MSTTREIYDTFADAIGSELAKAYSEAYEQGIAPYESEGYKLLSNLTRKLEEAIDEGYSYSWGNRVRWHVRQVEL